MHGAIAIKMMNMTPMLAPTPAIKVLKSEEVVVGLTGRVVAIVMVPIVLTGKTASVLETGGVVLVVYMGEVVSVL